MLGSNDLLQCANLGAEVGRKRMERFLRTLLAETQANLKILLIAPLPMKLGAWVSDPRTVEEFHRLAGCYKTAAQRLDIVFADAGAWGAELAYDGVHFSEEGHLAFAKGMRAVLNNLL